METSGPGWHDDPGNGPDSACPKDGEPHPTDPSYPKMVYAELFRVSGSFYTVGTELSGFGWTRSI